ncbi:outer membrane biogenesis protein BamB [Posidoniimonas polymericola]|uniref:Outer membrane biogenesis protein BamB n=1 Tax=Posidoniimonas polymericola TaxID=2528002 RepID=A0A5C5YML0_9BACT|nr:PQQ-binding-like beta-propeller repeat protein [Posidoniimonas polymericola]TWT76164.1 outer membrane biogenesis protein BamB [Posidoniimonas polymericola]
MTAKQVAVLGFSILVGGTLGCSPEPAADSPRPANASPDKGVGPVEPPQTADSGPRQSGARQRGVVATADLPKPDTLSEDDWPQFRGAKRDGVVRSSVRLARSWPADGPPKLWEVAVGQGYSAPSVVGDRVFLNDYDEEQSEWMVRCLSLESGAEQWAYKVPKRIRPNHAITRSAPATDGGFVFSIDPKCELHCVDARNGKLIWKVRLPQAYDSPIPAWYSGQCPLIDDGKLIVAVGGRALLVALDKATGDTIWETPNPDAIPVSHSSVMPIEIDGQRQYAYLTLQGLVGVSAETGEQLWSFPWKFNTAVAPSPLPLGEGRLLLTSGYHAQSVVCQVTRVDGQWSAAEVAAFPPPPRGWNSEVHTPIYYQGHVYGVGKSKRGMWTCLDLDGSELWTSGREASFGMGGYVLADSMFIALDGKSGALRLIDAGAGEYRQLAEAEILSGPDVWAPPVVSAGKLLVRDLGRLVCLDVEAHGEPLAASPGPKN